MPRETREAKRRRAAEALDRLEAEMPEARIQLDYRTPFELLSAVILSAQCTDERVNKVTPALFGRFRSVQAMARAEPAEVEPLIQSCGLFRAKAKALVSSARAIVAEHGGRVPSARAALEALPGVGRKTAGVVAITLESDHAFPVDTHVGRIARRLGLTRETDPDKVEQALQALLPKARWAKGHQLLIWHGRRTCTARAPACERCALLELCPRVGVRPRPAPRPSRS